MAATFLRCRICWRSGSGVLYFLAMIMGWGQAAARTPPPITERRFVIVAGLLNFIAAADAHHIALGKKP